MTLRAVQGEDIATETDHSFKKYLFFYDESKTES